MATLTEKVAPATENKTSSRAVLYVAGAAVAAVAILGVTAVLIPEVSVGNGRADTLSSYVPGQSPAAAPSVSDYPAGAQR